MMASRVQENEAGTQGRHNPTLADAPGEPAEDDNGWKPPTYG
jgi:hypothetical protein